MATTNNLKDFLTDVADAIREKEGSTGLINPQEFSERIRAIETGGGGGAVAVVEKDVNFRDYDGTILHSYTKAEFLALKALPELPTQPGLICQEWNWALGDAQSYVQDYDTLEIGAIYITDDGKTRLYISILSKSASTIPLMLSVGRTPVTIDWGDGNSKVLTSMGTYRTSHTYDSVGDYVITIDVGEETEGSGYLINLGTGDSTESTLGSPSETLAYTSALTKVELGYGLRVVQSYAFQSCPCLRSITIPKRVTRINAFAFKSCATLRYIALPSTVTQIDESAFASLYGLHTFSLPDAVLTFGNNAFQYPYTLTRLNLPPNVSSLPTQLFSYDYRTRVLHIPSKVTSIASYAFRGCTALSKVVIHGNPTIASGAFDSCKGIGEYRFAGATKVPTLSATSSLTVPAFCKIVVPDSLYDSWIKASNWSTYASCIVKASEYPD